MMHKLSLQQAKRRFIKFGTCFCDPEYFTIAEIPKTNIVLTNCGVCGKQHNKQTT